MILVTGGTGFVGSHVVHALRARELPVRVLVRDPRHGARAVAWGAELVAGDVVTIEPGLYRSGYGGLRLEDLVLVTNDGHEVLTNYPYDLTP